MRRTGSSPAGSGRKYRVLCPAGCVMSLFLTHILLYGMLVHRLVCRPPGCHTCGWKLEAVKGDAGDPPASYVQVITGLTRLLRGTLFQTSGAAAGLSRVPLRGVTGPAAKGCFGGLLRGVPLHSAPRLCAYSAQFDARSAQSVFPTYTPRENDLII